MSVVESTWKNYSKIKYDLDKELSGLQESHTKELSSLQARLNQSGISPEEDQYKLRVDKLIADQSEAQKSVTDARKELDTGAMHSILTDAGYSDSYGAHVRNLGMAKAAADDKARRAKEAERGDASPGAGGFVTPYSANRMGIDVGDFESFYEEKFGAYERPDDEIKAEKSASSIAQAQGVSGGQRAKSMSKRKSNTPASRTAGNPFLTGGAGLGSGAWWS